MNRRLALVAFILLSVLAVVPGQRTAKAQAPYCSDYSFPATPSGWTVITGSLTGSNFLSAVSGGQSLLDVSFSGFPHAVYVYSVTFTWIVTPSTFQSNGIAKSILGGVIQEQHTVLSTTYLQWQTTTFFFFQKPADQIEIILVNPSTSTYLTLGSVHICSTDAIEITSTSTSTPSTTPVPTSGASPTPTFTPSNTPTPTPSDTPASVGGLTVTPSLTPILASTLVGGATMSMNKNLFATVEGPHQCADAFNPCGALPFPVPPMATINLPSPTTLPSTPFITPAFGTPTGTSTAGPTMLTTDQAAVVQFATNAQGAASEVVVTPGLSGPPGSGSGGTADIANSANQIGAYIGDAFGIIRSIQGFFIGKTGAIIAFLLLVILFIIIVKITVFALPIIIAFFRLVFQLVGAIRPW